MNDLYREVTHRSWGQRIGSSFTGVLLGLAFFIGAFPLIWWNEGRSVDRIKTLSEGRDLVVSIDQSLQKPEHEGALVHLMGRADSDQRLHDQLFGIQSNGLKLRRRVELYQWRETKSSRTVEKTGGGETTETTYSYNKTWSEKLIDSSRFRYPNGHENPASKSYDSQTLEAGDIHVGAYQLGPAFVAQIDLYEPLKLAEDPNWSLPGDLADQLRPSQNYLASADLEQPKVGDIRISFSVVPAHDISVIGKQIGSALEPYKTENGVIQLLDPGLIAAADMFATAESENALLTWMIRLGGFILMWIGLAVCLRPLRTLGSILPSLGSILGAGIGLVTGILALVLSFIVMASAWLFYRPLIGGVLLACALFFLLGGFGYLRRKMRSTDQARTVARAG